MVLGNRAGQIHDSSPTFYSPNSDEPLRRNHLPRRIFVYLYLCHMPQLCRRQIDLNLTPMLFPQQRLG